MSAQSQKIGKSQEKIMIIKVFGNKKTNILNMIVNMG